MTAQVWLIRNLVCRQKTVLSADGGVISEGLTVIALPVGISPW